VDQEPVPGLTSEGTAMIRPVARIGAAVSLLLVAAACRAVPVADAPTPVPASTQPPAGQTQSSDADPSATPNQHTSGSGEMATTDEIRRLTGNCLVSSNSLTMIQLEPGIDDAVRDAGGAGNWLDDWRFAGTVEMLASALAATVYVDGETAAWLIVPNGDYPYGQEVLSAVTPEGVEVWHLIDQIRSCEDPAWPRDGEHPVPSG
jgi:hypothetical protein